MDPNDEDKMAKKSLWLFAQTCLSKNLGSLRIITVYVEHQNLFRTLFLWSKPKSL